jgi:hypothetical protein
MEVEKLNGRRRGVGRLGRGLPGRMVIPGRHQWPAASTLASAWVSLTHHMVPPSAIQHHMVAVYILHHTTFLSIKIKEKGGEKMTEEYRNIYEVGTVPLMGDFELVAIPSLIKVQVIKKKIVDQMSEPPLEKLQKSGDNKFRVLGRVGPYVVFHTDSHQFVKIHRNEYVDYAVSYLIKSLEESGEISPNDLQKQALEKFYQLPQMFEG